MDVLTLVYIGFAVLSVIGAVAVVFTRDTVHSAMSLVGVMLALAGLFLLMHQEFIAAIQVIVYAGAIMVLFLFVIMLLNLRQKEQAPWMLRRVRFWGGVLAMMLFFLLSVGVYTFSSLGPVASSHITPNFTVQNIAQIMLSKYLLPFELTSVLLLVAIVAAIIMARPSTNPMTKDISSSSNSIEGSRL